MTDSYIEFIEEPTIQFAHSQNAVDPHDGLAYFGPFDLKHPQSPHHAVIGTKSGISAWKLWSIAINQAHAVDKVEKFKLWPPFPGYHAAFGGHWTERPVAEYELDPNTISDASRKSNIDERCGAVVQEYLKFFKKMDRLDRRPDLVICVVPDEVYKNCRPESRVLNPSDQVARSKKARQGKSAEAPEFAPDFRRRLKAMVMEHNLPIQIVRETTLRLSDEHKLGSRGLTPLSDRMWNLCTCLYYKAGGKPWRLNTARFGVSYVGIAFRKVGGTDRSACCVAQMFLDSGDGIVFMGEEGAWYSPEDKKFHLDKGAAKKLLAGVIQTYKDEDSDAPLREIFLHCRSEVSAEEYEGYKEAVKEKCPPGCKLIAVRVRRDRFAPRLFRDGTRPVLRGTTWVLSDRSAYLYASGFKERLGTYDGSETPAPLKIDIQHGEADILQVCKDILGLTKLNYNTCKLGESEPVTIGFSDQVGEILLSNPGVTKTRPNFKYYI